MTALTPVRALQAIDAASGAQVWLRNATESFAKAADDSFFRPHPQYGTDHVASTIDDLAKSQGHLSNLVDSLPDSSSFAARQAQAGVDEVATMGAQLEAGAAPFNFVQRIQKIESDMLYSIRSFATDGLNATSG